MGDEERYVHAGPSFPFPEVTTSLGVFLHEHMFGTSADPLLINAETGESVRAEDVALKAVSIATELRARGVRPGDVVSTALENCFEFSYIMLGSFFAGAVLAPVNPNLITSDLRELFRMLEPRLIFSLPRVLGAVQEAKHAKSDVVEVSRFGADWNKFISHRGIADFKPTPTDNVDSPALIICSSGTTGTPKGIIMTHRNAVLFGEMNRMHFEDTGTVSCLVSPTFWTSGLLYTLGTLCSRATQVFLNNFEVDLYLRTLEKYRVNSIFLSPPHVVAIAKNASAGKYDLSSVGIASVGGAGVSQNMKEKAEEILGAKFTNFYGQTEALYLIFLPGPLSEEKPGTIGTVGPNCSVKVVDTETGKALGPKQEGEICIKMPFPFNGYYRNPEATSSLIDSNGWLHTGDVGHYDEDGYFFICDRIKELIKYKGNALPPGDIESVLLSHPGVKDAAVAGIFHDDDQERAVGFVVKQPGAEVTKEELLQLTREQLPEYKWPHGGIYFIAEIPRTPSGKIMRRKLRQRATQYSKL